MSKNFPYGRQDIDDSDIDAVVNALKGDYLTGGPLVEEFEKKLADLVGAKYAVVVSSGTAALHIAYAAAGLASGHTVLTTPLSFAATANAALYCGAKVLFTDILPSGNIDPAGIESAIETSTRIIVPVHYAGQSADMLSIKKIADKYNIAVIEDACHALGAFYQDLPVGSCQYSDMTLFSFHPVKHVTTGEGGAITTNNKDYYDKLKLLRSHGIVTPAQNWKKNMLLLGYNYRITDIQCALGLSQLKRLDSFITKRHRIAALYDQLLKKNRHFEALPVYEKGHSYHIYPVLLRADADRDMFIENAQKAGIGVQVHYGLIYNHQYYRENGYGDIYLPVAESIAAREISLPIYPAIADEDVHYIVGLLTSIGDSL